MQIQNFQNIFIDIQKTTCYHWPCREVITLEIYERVRKVREDQNLTRAQFAERLGISAAEITNVEFNKIKRPESKESLYRSISAEFGVSLEWLKSGVGNMYGPDAEDVITQAFGELAARKDPVIDGFIQFLRSRTKDELDLLYKLLRDCVDQMEDAAKQQEK